MNPDIDDEFPDLPVERSKITKSSRVGDSGVDEFPDEPVSHSHARNSSVKNVGAPTNSPGDLEDEFPDDPMPAGPLDASSDHINADPHWLFPEGWDTQMSSNTLDDRVDFMFADSDDVGVIKQEMLEEYAAIKKRTEELNLEKYLLRLKFLRCLEAGYGVEPGLMKLIHDRRMVKLKSYQAIASVLGEVVTDHLMANLPAEQRDFISVREVKPKKVKKAK